MIIIGSVWLIYVSHLYLVVKRLIEAKDDLFASFLHAFVWETEAERFLSNLI